MANFCGKCGAPQGGSAFCPQCGTRNAPGAAAPVTPGPVTPSPIAPPPPTTASSSSSGLKVILVILGCLGLVGILAIGGLYYVAHRVKQAVFQKAAENGVDLDSITSSVPRSNAPRPKIKKLCDYLSKEEASRLIGEPVERAEVQESMCLYYGPAGLSAKLAEEQASREFKRAQTPNSKADGMEVANAVDQLANSMGAQAGQTGSGGELPLLMLGVDADGKAQMTAVSASKAIFGGIVHASDPKAGMLFGADIPNLGDKAIRLPKLGLNVLQGEILIRIIPGPLPDADAKTIDVARAVLPRL
jgi:hypothetical protein